MDINEQIRSNLGLVYKQLHRFNLVDDPDAESFAYEALYKAIITYNSASGNAFSTYAVCVIANSLRLHIRNKTKKRQIVTISLNTPIGTDEDSIYLMDTIETKDSVEDILITKELSKKANECIAHILSEANETTRSIITEWYASDFRLPQKEIANKLGVSQAYVSRAISNFKYKLKVELEDYL